MELVQGIIRCLRLVAGVFLAAVCSVACACLCPHPPPEGLKCTPHPRQRVLVIAETLGDSWRKECLAPEA